MKRAVSLLVLLALVVAAAGVVSAQETRHVLENFNRVHGFTTENKAIISYNYDPAYVKEGDVSLKVVKEAGDQRSMVRFRNYHSNFISDLTAYNRLSFWVYFEDVSLLREDAAIGVSFWLTSGSKINFMYPVDILQDGWNYVVVDMADPQKYFMRKDVDLIEFQVRTADGETEMVYYYDDISLYWED